jgi:hypothetical protein
VNNCRELCLVGLLPQDPDGQERLLTVLDTIQPDAIAVEESAAILTPNATARATAEEALAVIGSRLDDVHQLEFWRKRLAPEHVAFPAFASAAYAARRGIPVHFLGDDSEPASVGDALALVQLDAETLRGMAAFDWQSVYAQDYGRARRDLENKGCVEFLVPVGQHRSFYERECALAAQVEQLLGRPGTQHLALICAIPHLYYSDTQLTLYMQLGQGTARRYLTDGQGEIRDLAIAHP